MTISAPPGAPASTRRRIMHVIEPAPYGGAETVVSALARGAAARGDEVHVVTLRQVEEAGDFLARLRGDRIETTELRCGRRRYLREVKELTTLIRRWRPDVVHTHVYHADIVGYFAAKAAGVPVVATVHGFTAGSLRNRFYQWLDLRVLKHVQAVTCVSQKLVDSLRGMGFRPSRVHFVPNAHDGSIPLARADARKSLGLAEHGLFVGWIGRLSHEKAPERFVRVLASVGLDATGVIVGDGPELPALRQQIAAFGAPVKLVGAFPDAGRLVAAFDVIAVTSRTEGLPMTVLHAMAAGVPVIATAVGALPDVLGDASGWVVDPSDESAFSAALTEALSSPTAMQQRAERARFRLDRLYSLRSWLDRMDEVYDQSALRDDAA